jgi:hypothetical protein
VHGLQELVLSGVPLLSCFRCFGRSRHLSFSFQPFVRPCAKNVPELKGSEQFEVRDHCAC